MKLVTKRVVWTTVLAAAISLVLAGLLALVQLFPDAPDLSYRSMEQHATMLSNGDLKIEQTIDVVMQDRDKPWRQLFQTYTVTDSGPTSISDITVTNLSTGKQLAQGDGMLPDDSNFAQWDSEHANHWYIVDADSRQPYNASETGTHRLELGWNIPTTKQSDSMRFAISMTWHGAATRYRDVTAMLWEPIAATNEVPIGTLTGTFTFPQGATERNTWAWLHFTGTSSTRRTTDAKGNTQLSWQAWNVQSEQYVDLQIMMDNALTDHVVRQVDQNYKAKLLAQEASDEQHWREQQRTKARMIVIGIVVCALLGVAAVVVGSASLVKRLREWRKVCTDAVYWRQAPELSPASAAKLSDLCQFDKEHRGAQIAATMLSLANRGLILLYPGKAQWYEDAVLNAGSDAGTGSGSGQYGASARDTQHAAYVQALQQRFASDADKGLLRGIFDSNRAASKYVTIVLHDEQSAGQAHTAASAQSESQAQSVARAQSAESQLYQSERDVLTLLRAASDVVGSSCFDTHVISHIDRYCKSNHDRALIAKRAERISSSIDAEFAARGITRHTGALSDAMAVIALLAGAGFAAVSFFMNMGMVLLIAACVMWFCGLSLLMLNMRRCLTERGIQYAHQVVGLRKYMEDFSNFGERDVLSLTLWNDYLVYAVAMGIADVAMRQLAVNYPQEISDPEWLDSYAQGSSMYWMRYSMFAYGSSLASHQTGQVSTDSLATSFASSWNDLGTVLSGSMTNLQQTIAVAGWSGNGGKSTSGFGNGSFSTGGFGGASGGIGGGSFGGR